MGSEASEAPWWHKPKIIWIIVFRTTTMWMTAFAVLSAVNVSPACFLPNTPGSFDFLQVLSESFLPCAGWSFAIGAGFGIPRGIIDVLSRREREIELEQDLEKRAKEKSP